MREHEYEPVRGLPEQLPTGEAILWQGAPDWRSLAVRGFNLRWAVPYFAFLVVVRAVATLGAGADLPTMLLDLVPYAGLALAFCALVAIYAWLVVRKTVYTVTNKRLVVRSGVALDMTVNIPFSLVRAASVSRHRDGTGDIALEIAPPNRVALFALWPHTRPGHWRRPQPMLRSLADPDRVAALLRPALAAALPAVGAPPDPATSTLARAAA